MKASHGLLVVLVVATALHAVASDGRAQSVSISDIFEAANLAASQGDHETAIANYRMLVDAGVRDPDVYFNLATAHAQSGDFPRAILNYERALTLRPGDEKAEENLRAAERALEEERAEREGEAMIQRSSSLADTVFGRFQESTLAYLLLATNALFFGGLAWVWIADRRRRRFYGLLVTSGLLFVFAAIGLGHKAGVLRDGPRAVALTDRVALREGPYPRAQVRGEARGGDRGIALARDGVFVKWRLASGLEGWAPASDIGLIDLDQSLH